MIVDVAYTVPVYARVNTDTGEVERVVIYDEGIEAKSAYSIDVAESFPYERPVASRVGVEYEKASKIAESAEWPVWESGF